MYVWKSPHTYPYARVRWGTFHSDIRRTGAYHPLEVSPAILTSIRVSPSGCVLEGKAQPGTAWNVLCATEVTGPWSTIATIQADEDGTLRFLQDNASTIGRTTCFYTLQPAPDP